MSTYRERREARAERLRGWADKRETKADAAHARASQMADAIPFGQPVMGARDRNYRDRIGATMTRALEHDRKADAMRAKADNIEHAAAGAIYRDDPDAIEALTAKLARLEAERDRIKAYNASCRKGAPDLAVLNDRERADLVNLARVCPYRIGKGGQFPAYALSNLAGVIGTTRKRLAEQIARGDTAPAWNGVEE